MNRAARISLLHLALAPYIFLIASNIATAGEFIPPSEQLSVFDQIVDFLIRNQSWVLGALAVAFFIANPITRLAAGGRGPAFTSFRVVAFGVALLSGGAVVYMVLADKKVVGATNLPLPDPACKPGRPSATTAVVFLHGWKGSADETWANFPSLACNDNSLSDAEIYVVNYPTFLERQQLPVASLARWLRQSFFSDTLKKYQDIHVIAHSMGGPMARSIYLNDMLAANSSKVRSVITVASPYLGAQIAPLAKALGISEKLTTDMETGSSFLQTLANNWTDVRARPLTYCFASPQDWIVTPDSAKSQCECTHDYPQWGHVDMVKPILANDERYRMPIRALNNARIATQASPAQVRHQCFTSAIWNQGIEQALYKDDRTP